MIINIDLLSEIKALNPVLATMDDSQYSDYCRNLDVFIENYPEAELELKDALDEKDYNVFSKTIMPLIKMLRKIYARNLEQKGKKILDGFKTTRYATIQAQLNDFLTELSTLSIDIQMAQHKTAMVGIQPKKDQSYIISGRQKSILAVDDSVILLDGLKMLLSDAGFKFTGVTSGEDALRFMKKHDPDLIVLDISMPLMNGYQLAKKIKDCGYKTPIIFLTGSATKDDVLKALDIGATDFVVKSATKDQLLDKINKYI